MRGSRSASPLDQGHAVVALQTKRPITSGHTSGPCTFKSAASSANRVHKHKQLAGQLAPRRGESAPSHGRFVQCGPGVILGRVFKCIGDHWTNTTTSAFVTLCYDRYLYHTLRSCTFWVQIMLSCLQCYARYTAQSTTSRRHLEQLSRPKRPT